MNKRIICYVFTAISITACMPETAIQPSTSSNVDNPSGEPKSNESLKNAIYKGRFVGDLCYEHSLGRKVHLAEGFEFTLENDTYKVKRVHFICRKNDKAEYQPYEVFRWGKDYGDINPTGYDVVQKENGFEMKDANGKILTVGIRRFSIEGTYIFSSLTDKERADMKSALEKNQVPPYLKSKIEQTLETGEFIHAVKVPECNIELNDLFEAAQLSSDMPNVAPCSESDTAKLPDFNSGHEMVQIPAGSFMMGCSEGDSECDDDEKPRHQVNVSAFALSKTEVTFAQYDVFAKATNRELPNDEGWGRGNRPVINVNWLAAVAYTKWLSEQTGQQYRLPTEAEWEFAARSGNTSKYSWGDIVGSNNANCFNCGSQWDNKQTAPVASFGANTFGMYDMHGNVGEWTNDCWNTGYDNAPSIGNAWLSGDCTRRVIRGGSWSSSKSLVRASERSGARSDIRNNNIGFRVAQDLSQ